MPTHPGPDFLPPLEDGPPPVPVPVPPPVTGPAPAPPSDPPRRPGIVVAAVVAMVLAGGVSGAVGAQLTSPGGVTALPRVSGPAPALAPTGIADVAAAVLPAVVSVEVRGAGGQATGSGFVIDDRGHVVTNAHVVASGGQVQLVLSDGRRVAAEIVGTDPSSDVAVLSAPAAGLPAPLPLGTSADLRVGEAVLAVGSPLGLSGTVTAGIVSATDRETRLGNSGARQVAVQTDAAINPGNSGGPLVDAAGRVVGVNTSIATLGSGNIGIGFAIPIDRAADVAQRLIARSS